MFQKHKDAIKRRDAAIKKVEKYSYLKRTNKKSHRTAGVYAQHDIQQEICHHAGKTHTGPKCKKLADAFVVRSQLYKQVGKPLHSV